MNYTNIFFRVLKENYNPSGNKEQMQRLIAVSYENKSKKAKDNYTIAFKDNKKDVSIEKFVYASGSDFDYKTGKLTNDAIISYEASGQRSQMNASSTSKNISKWQEVDSSKGTKYSNPVAIAKNDYVIYRINVWNNEKKEVNVRIKDFPNGKAVIKSVYEWDTSKNESESRVLTKTECENNLKVNDGECISWDTTLEKNEKCKTFHVVIKYNNYMSGKIQNKARVYIIHGTNSTTYRIKDSDYVKMDVDMSIQKYIVAVGKSFTKNKDNATKTDYPYKIAEDDFLYKYNRTKRWLRPAKDDSNDNIFVSSNSAYSGKQGEEYPSNCYTNKTTKFSDPVQINDGNYVVYRVDVYNNLDTRSAVTLKDKLSVNVDSIQVFEKCNTDSNNNKLFR